MHFFLKISAKKFGGNKKMPTFAIPNETNTVSNHAEVAQLVEHNLAKVGVASSSLVFRSKNKKSAAMLTFVLKNITRRGSIICQSSLCTRDGFFVFNNLSADSRKRKGVRILQPQSSLLHFPDLHPQSRRPHTACSDRLPKD